MTNFVTSAALARVYALMSDILVNNVVRYVPVVIFFSFTVLRCTD